jgi:hypothetical protein
LRISGNGVEVDWSKYDARLAKYLDGTASFDAYPMNLYKQARGKCRALSWIAWKLKAGSWTLWELDFNSLRAWQYPQTYETQNGSGMPVYRGETMGLERAD